MRLVLAGLLCAGLATAAAAQTAPPATPPARPDCKAAEHHQLDFWVGEWRVFRAADGVEVATSSIQSVANGCGISENYTSPRAPGGPYQGLSYSAFDRRDGKWRQFYVDVSGAATWYIGGMEGASMVLYAEGPKARQRMTYRPNPDGSVNQTGVVSADGGQTWQPGYDYVYRRK